jgi:hypothetical protein
MAHWRRRWHDLLLLLPHRRGRWLLTGPMACQRLRQGSQDDLLLLLVLMMMMLLLTWLIA